MIPLYNALYFSPSFVCRLVLSGVYETKKRSAQMMDERRNWNDFILIGRKIDDPVCGL